MKNTPKTPKVIKFPKSPKIRKNTKVVQPGAPRKKKIVKIFNVVGRKLEFK